MQVASGTPRHSGDLYEPLGSVLELEVECCRFGLVGHHQDERDSVYSEPQ